MPIQVPTGQLRPGAIDVPQASQFESTGDAQRIAAAQTAQVGRLAGQVGGQMAQFGTELYTQANDAMSKQQAVLHSRELDELLRDYQSKQGHDAYMGREAFDKAAGQLRAKYAKALQNDDQITLFNRMVDAQMAQADGRATAHNTRETRAWNIQMTQVNLNKHAQDYADAAAEDEDEIDVRRQIYKNSGLSPEDAQAEVDAELGASDSRMDRMGVARAAMEAEFLKLQKLAGLDDKTAREAMKVSVQQLHGSTMKMLTDQDPKKARAYFDANKDEMSAAQVATITKQLDKLDTEDRALATVRKAMASVGPDATPTERYQAVLDAAAKEDDAEAYRLIVSFGNSELAQQQRVDNGRKNDLIEQAEVFIYAPENKGKTYEDLPPSMREDLEENGLVDEVMDIVGGRDRRTQEAAMVELLRNPEVLDGMDEAAFVRKYRPILSSADFNRAQKAWAAYNVREGAKPVSDLLTYKDALDHTLQLLELDKESVKDNPEKQAVFNRIRQAVQRMIDNNQLTQDMTFDQQMKVIGGLFEQEATIRTMFGSTTKPYETMTRDEQLDAVVAFKTVSGETAYDKPSRIPDVPPTTGGGEVGVKTYLIEQLTAAAEAQGLVPDLSQSNQLRLWHALGQPKTIAEAKAYVAENRETVRQALLPQAQVTPFGMPLPDVVPRPMPFMTRPGK